MMFKPVEPLLQSDLEGPMKGKEISDLVSAMSSGVTYVNVHTQANPNGEIRGQISLPEYQG